MNGRYLALAFAMFLAITIIPKSVSAQTCSFVNTAPTINGTYNQAAFQCSFSTVISQPTCITTNSITPTPYSTCYGNTGNSDLNPNNIGSNPTCSIYCANMTIYFNPAGFFEYAIDDGNNLFLSNPTLYQNTAPDYSVYNLYNDYINATQVAGQNFGMKNFTYEGAIFYSGLIDISPVESRANSGNLTIADFLSFVQQNQQSFDNTTVILKTPDLQISGTAIEATIINGLQDSIIPFTFFIASLTNPAGQVQQVTNIVSNNVAYINTTQVTVPLVASLYPNTGGYIQVFYDYEGSYVDENTFNQNFDQFDSPQLAAYNFITNTAPLLLLITVLLFIVSKVNGE